MFASEELIDYPRFMYTMQWLFFRDGEVGSGESLFSLEEKEIWLGLIPQVWLGVSEEKGVKVEDILYRLSQIFGRKQFEKFIQLLRRT